MRRARASIAEGGAANLRGRHGELAASAEGGVGTGRGERASVASTGCGESARLVRRSARRRWVSFGAERCLSVGLPAPPRRRGWQRGAGELQGGKLRCRALLCSYSLLAFLDNLRWWWWGVLTDVPVQDDGHDHTRCRRPKAAQQWYGLALETVAALCNRLRTSIEAALSPDERRQPGPPPPVARCRNLDGGPTLHILRT